MLKIYDAKADVPENLVEFYQKSETSGKYEPKIEGINSVSGLIAKRDELLEKVKVVPGLKTKVQELEGQETLPAGKIAVDKKEFEALKTSNEAYTALGTIDDIKPKVEGYDELKTKEERRTKEDEYRTAARAAGYDETKFVKLALDDNLQTIVKTVKENGKDIEKVFVKSQKDGKEMETAITDYVKESPNFSPFADSLTATTALPSGQKVIRQGTQPATPTLETEIAAAKSSGVYASL